MLVSIYTFLDPTFMCVVVVFRCCVFIKVKHIVKSETFNSNVPTFIMNIYVTIISDKIVYENGKNKFNVSFLNAYVNKMLV